MNMRGTTTLLLIGCWLLGAACDEQPEIITSQGPGVQSDVATDTGGGDGTDGTDATDAAADVVEDTGDNPPDTSEDTGPPVGCVDAIDCVGKVTLLPCQRPLCTAGECGVESSSDGTPCSDGDPCFSDRVCTDGECGGGFLIGCEDGDPCTQDQCDSFLGCVHVPSAGGCDDGNSCTLADYCLDGVCTPGSSVCPCIADEDCNQWNDGNVCTGQLKCYGGLCKPDPASISQCPTGAVSACEVRGCDPSSGECAIIALGDGTPCTDNDPCTTGDACQNGQCAGTPGGCVCETDADCLAFDDGNLCNGRPTCSGGQCVFDPSTIIDCAGTGGPCEAGACEPLTGECTASPTDGALCDDGDPCTNGDVCADGACSGVAVVCDDVNPCTDDSCDGTGTCQYVANTGPCSDNDECTVGDACVDGACIPGVDQCSCATPEDCAAFDDGDPCNGVLTCVNNMCQPEVGSEVVCDGSGNTDCQINACNPASGECELMPANQGAPCFDGDPCTEGEFCDAGQCGGVQSQCNCQPAGDLLTCTSFPTKWANFAFGSTQNVDAWTCSPGDYSSKEYTWQVFTSQPVAMTVTLSKEDAKTALFVVEDDGTGCSPQNCQKTHPSSLTFVAWPDKTQYVVVDSKDGTSGEFEMEVSCQFALELTCDNGFDEDNDGLTDCNDPDCDEDPWCAGVEDCTNQLDDDNDGKVDCSDPECQGDPICNTICTPQTNAYCGLSTFWTTGGVGSTDAVDTYSCSQLTFDGSEVVYTFNSQTTQAVTVSLPEFFPGANVMVLQQQQGACNGAYCIATGPTEASFFATAGVTYYFVVDGQFGAEGDYKINVACQ